MTDPTRPLAASPPAAGVAAQPLGGRSALVTAPPPESAAPCAEALAAHGAHVHVVDLGSRPNQAVQCRLRGAKARW